MGATGDTKKDAAQQAPEPIASKTKAAESKKTLNSDQPTKSSRGPDKTPLDSTSKVEEPAGKEEAQKTPEPDGKEEAQKTSEPDGTEEAQKTPEPDGNEEGQKSPDADGKPAAGPKKGCCGKCCGCGCCGGCCGKCCGRCCGFLKKALWTGHSRLIWIVHLLAIFMLLHLILLEGCGINTLKFVDIMSNYKEEPMIAFMATLVYFIFLIVVCFCYFFPKWCCVPKNPRKKCTCKEITLTCYVIYGVLLACFILTMTKLPTDDLPPTHGSNETVAEHMNATGEDFKTADKEVKSVEFDTGRSLVEPGKYEPKYPRRANVPQLDHMNCTGYCHLYVLLLILLGVLAFVIYSLERRRRLRQVAAGGPDVEAPPQNFKSQVKQAKSTASHFSKSGDAPKPSHTTAKMSSENGNANGD